MTICNCLGGLLFHKAPIGPCRMVIALHGYTAREHTNPDKPFISTFRSLLSNECLELCQLCSSVFAHFTLAASTFLLFRYWIIFAVVIICAHLSLRDLKMICWDGFLLALRPHSTNITNSYCWNDFAYSLYHLGFQRKYFQHNLHHNISNIEKW